MVVSTYMHNTIGCVGLVVKRNDSRGFRTIYRRSPTACTKESLICIHPPNRSGTLVHYHCFVLFVFSPHNRKEHSILRVFCKMKH